MSFREDARRIERIVRREDAAFAACDAGTTEPLLREVRALGERDDRDAFLLAAMRLLALPGNGHTRLIPNAAIAVRSLRFVAIGEAVWLTAAPPGLEAFLDRALVAIDDAPVAALEAAAAPWLAGTPQRRRAIGALLLAWPAALRALGARAGGARYALADAEGRIAELRPHEGPLAPAAALYPIRERGGLEAAPAPPDFVGIEALPGDGLLLRLPDFFDPGGRALAPAIERAAAEIQRLGPRRLVLDLRGNPGGDFTKALPLIDAIARSWRGEACHVAVDKFTFSAAIVIVALLRHGLKERMILIGEPMGDGLRFFAEGDTAELPQSGAAARYATALHDWERGAAGPTTPPGIARHMVAAGPLSVDHALTATARDLRSGRDPLRPWLATLDR